MNWTIREDRFQLFSFLGGFFADGDGLIVANAANQKSCPQIGHTTMG
jgi:hypothetical protein